MKTPKRWLLWQRFAQASTVILFIGFIIFTIFTWTSPNPVDSLLSLALFAGIVISSFMDGYVKYRITGE